MKLFILFLLVAAVVAIETYVPDSVNCPANKSLGHYHDCPESCLSLIRPPTFCRGRMAYGCHCNKGYVLFRDRDFSSDCIKPEDCPTNPVEYDCPENSHYDDCGTACPVACGNYENPPGPCYRICNPGCHCDEGYVRTEMDVVKCVKPTECRSSAPVSDNCPANQSVGFYRDCPESCLSLILPPEICTLELNYGCKCNEGYVIEDIDFTYNCIKPEDCPTTPVIQVNCPSNKEFGSFSDCPDSCYSFDHPVRACTLELNYGCKCKAGYVLREDKVFSSDCIRLEECP